MNYTEEYCKDLLQKIIDDLDEQRGGIFYANNIPFKADFIKNQKNLFSKEIIEDCWVTRATVPKDGWKGGFIIICVDDDTGKALTYMNSALGGRPITLPLEINEEGKYYIPNDVLPE